MADKITVQLIDEARRARAHHYIDRAPEGWQVTLTPPTRSTPQNAAMWALLNDIRRAKPDGRDMPAEKWKAIFMESLGHKAEFVPNLDQTSFLCLGYRSSRLTKGEFSDLIECILEYGARKGVRWSLPESQYSEFL